MASVDRRSGAFFDLNATRGGPDADVRRCPGSPFCRASCATTVPGPTIRHAFSRPVRSTNGYVYPASHRAGSNSQALPMGGRLRLKASKDLSPFTPEVRKIFRAMQRHGLIVADNGSDMYVSGAFDPRWNNDVLNRLARADGERLDVIELGWRGGGVLDARAASPSAQSGGYVVRLGAAAGAADCMIRRVAPRHRTCSSLRGRRRWAHAPPAATMLAFAQACGLACLQKRGSSSRPG
jgi:hypothetical protein